MDLNHRAHRVHRVVFPCGLRRLSDEFRYSDIDTAVVDELQRGG